MLGEFEFSSSRLQFIEFDEDLAPIRRGDKEKIDPRAICPSSGFRIDGRDSEFFFQDLRSAFHIHAAILHLLNPFSKFGQVLRKGPRTSPIRRCPSRASSRRSMRGGPSASSSSGSKTMERRAAGDILFPLRATV